MDCAIIAGCKDEKEKNGTSFQAADEACAANPTLRNGGTNSKKANYILFVHFGDDFIVCCFTLSFSLLDVEHRKSFAEMTEAQVHPASSASAPEGFLNPQDNPNGNENSIGSTRYHFVCDFKNCNRFGFLLHKVKAVCAARLLFQISGHCWIKDQILSAKSGPICW